MDTIITIAVRELVEFVLRGGSIDNRFGGLDRMAEGSRIHRRLQKAAGESYQAEVPLSLESRCGALRLLVEGRADGVYTDGEGTVVDEIKTTGAPLELITEDFNPLHWAQAMCYAHMLCIREGWETMRVRLTYYQVDTDEIRRFIRAYTADELAAFYADLLERYRRWGERRQDWEGTRDASIKATAFPYPHYRPGQRRLAEAVYRTARDGGRLFCQAPTGIGKTISTLFPAIKAIGEGIADKIFYLTAKTITRQVAESACDAMRAGGLRLKTVTLTAKDKICFLERRNCNPDACPYADGHFDRVNGALEEMLEREEAFTREKVETYARRHRVCPFELALDLTLWCDVIIADYNYIFDPQVYLRRFFTGGPGPYVFLIDEAHNLVDRAREMYSAGLRKSDFLQMSRALGKKDKLRRSLAGINTAMIAMRKECGEAGCLRREEPYREFHKQLARTAADCEEWLQQHPHAPEEEQLLNLYFGVLSFLRIAELYDERYITSVEAKGSEVALRLFCLDPSYLLSKAMERGRASVLFSATLTPLDYFVSVLGGDESARRLTLASPFPAENLCLLVSDRISTKYKDRRESLGPVADQIALTVGAKRGNYLVYFPSYAYLQEVYEVFQERYPDIPTLVQRSGMEEEEREAFLERFQAGGMDSLIGFCVLGGIYAEGIDLRGERLIGTVIVGVGLPQIGPEQDMIRDYYDRQGGRGFDYAYRYPGMNKVLQAAGRVIRDERDRGVVVLIDQRFTSPAYRPLFPEHWRHYAAVRSGVALEERLHRFWAGN